MCDSNFPLKRDEVEEITYSFGIHSDGLICMEGKWEWNADCKFGAGDVIGCGMELVGNGRQLFFTKNGKICGEFTGFLLQFLIYSNLTIILIEPFPFSLHANQVELFPTVSMLYQCEVQANFGHEPFEYDLAQHPTTNCVD